MNQLNTLIEEIFPLLHELLQLPGIPEDLRLEILRWRKKAEEYKLD